LKPIIPTIIAILFASIAAARTGHAAPGLLEEVGGVGMAIEKKDGRFLVHQLLDGSPAAHSRMIEIGDELLAIKPSAGREVKTKGLPFEIVVDLIRGVPGETVELKLKRPHHEAPIRVSLRREPIRVED
jgi:carboxyl-terminal processing protease